jgi:hypothetical protein
MADDREPDPPPDGEADDERAAGSFIDSQAVHQHFHGDVYADGANFGIRTARVRRGTGPVRESEIVETVERYQRPVTFAAAETVLRERRIVVLSGADGSGRRAAALVLLRECAKSARIVGLSPVLTLDELLDHKFRSGHGYLVQDRVPDVDAAGESSHAFDSLTTALRRAGAYLVITTTHPSGRTPREVVVSWASPDPLDLLAAELAAHGQAWPAGELGDRVRERFATSRNPAEIVAFARQVGEAGGDAQRCLELIESSAADEVAGWFDQEPDEELVLFVTAVAFGHGVPERSVERALAELRRSLDAVRPEPPSGNGEVASAPPAPVVTQRRRTRLGQVPFVRVAKGGTTDGGTTASERTLVFASAAHHLCTVDELWARYDQNLWDIARPWVRASAGGAGPREDLGAALGVALLAGFAPEEAQRAYLDEWAARPSARAAACYALWFAAQMDSRAAWALGLATRWAAGKEPARVRTAIAALSGDLGLRYPGEARRWLWHLSTHPHGPRGAARKALAQLFVSAVDLGDAGAGVPGLLHRKVGDLADRGVPSADRRAALDIAELVLGAKARTRRPAVADLLMRSTAQATTFGELWAAGLSTRPYRGRALETLRDTLRALHDHGGDRSAVAALGAAIVAALPLNEIEPLKRDLRHQLLSRSGDRDAAGSIIDDLLADQPPDPTDQEDA